VEKHLNGAGGSTLIITNTSDDRITIGKVTANRGNCTDFTNLLVPSSHVIAFGDKDEFAFGCDVIEAEVSTTNAGTWTYKFDPL
jgi:hypothetical protein